MAMKLTVMIGALGLAAPAHGAASEPVTQCLIPAPPASYHVELLAAYRRLVGAFAVCIDAELTEFAAQDTHRGEQGAGRDSSAKRRKAALAERAAAIDALRRYERQIAR
ncbi:hypothetical protein [Sphingopyxis fribergensis]